MTVPQPEQTSACRQRRPKAEFWEKAKGLFHLFLPTFLLYKEHAIFAIFQLVSLGHCQPAQGRTLTVHREFILYVCAFICVWGCTCQLERPGQMFFSLKYQDALPFVADSWDFLLVHAQTPNNVLRTKSPLGQLIVRHHLLCHPDYVIPSGRQDSMSGCVCGGSFQRPWHLNLQTRKITVPFSQCMVGKRRGKQRKSIYFMQELELRLTIGFLTILSLIHSALALHFWLHSFQMADGGSCQPPNHGSQLLEQIVIER